MIISLMGFLIVGLLMMSFPLIFSLLQCSSVDIDFLQTGSALQEQESPKQCPQQSYSTNIDFSQASTAGDEHNKKRGRSDSCSKPKTKASRERERREKLNKSMAGLSSILEPGRIPKTDKLDILNDAIRVVNRLRTETEEYKVENKKLQEEIQSLKAEKNELREEKLTLKAEKEMMEQQLKVMPVPNPALVPSYPAAYHGGANKLDLYPSYGMYPMWHYLPPSTRDTSRDHELWPPAA